MGRADGISGRQGIIRQPEIFRNLAHQNLGALPIGEALSKETMKDGAGSIHGLQLIFHLQRIEDIIAEAYRQVSGIGIIGGLSLFCRRNDVRKFLRIMFGKTIGRGFGRRRFQIIQIPIFFLIIGKPLSHVLQHFFCKLSSGSARQVAIHPDRI